METSVVGADVQTSPERRPKQVRDPETCPHMRRHLSVLSESVRSKLRALRQAMRPVGKAGPQTP